MHDELLICQIRHFFDESYLVKIEYIFYLFASAAVDPVRNCDSSIFPTRLFAISLHWHEKIALKPSRYLALNTAYIMGLRRLELMAIISFNICSTDPHLAVSSAPVTSCYNIQQWTKRRRRMSKTRRFCLKITCMYTSMFFICSNSSVVSHCESREGTCWNIKQQFIWIYFHYTSLYRIRIILVQYVSKTCP